MKLLEKLKRLFNSEDDKPVTVSFLLGRDCCSRLLADFSEDALHDAEQLVIVWRARDGSLGMCTSSNLDELTAAGMLSAAQQVVINGE